MQYIVNNLLANGSSNGNDGVRGEYLDFLDPERDRERERELDEDLELEPV